MVGMARKGSVLKGFPVGAWAGACFGLTSTIIVMGLSTILVPKPYVFALMSAVLAAILLVGGVAGFTLFKEFTKPYRKRR